MGMFDQDQPNASAFMGGGTNPMMNPQMLAILQMMQNRGGQPQGMAPGMPPGMGMPPQGGIPPQLLQQLMQNPMLRARLMAMMGQQGGMPGMGGGMPPGAPPGAMPQGAPQPGTFFGR